MTVCVSLSPQAAFSDFLQRSSRDLSKHVKVVVSGPCLMKLSIVRRHRGGCLTYPVKSIKPSVSEGHPHASLLIWPKCDILAETLFPVTATILSFCVPLFPLCIFLCPTDWTLKCDGTDLTAKIQELKFQCIVFLNIPRFVSGFKKPFLCYFYIYCFVHETFEIHY